MSMSETPNTESRIVEGRLRTAAELTSSPGMIDVLCDAADEIARLRAELEVTRRDYSDLFVRHQNTVEDNVALRAALRSAEEERDEAHRKYGKQQIALDNCRKDLEQEKKWYRGATECMDAWKAEAGYSRYTSFDDVWRETLEKARKFDALTPEQESEK